MEKVILQDLGLITYKKAWDYQLYLAGQIIDKKMLKRSGNLDLSENNLNLHYLIFCQHPPVFTLGKSGSIENLKINDKELKENEIDFFKINRGGDITFHGPGQIVAYPIFDLDRFFTDVHKYVRYLEEVVIRTLAEYGLKGKRVEGFTGVWLDADEFLPQRKICAIGVHLSRWVTMHGFALNVNTNLDYFNLIIPCGINDKDKSVTSLEIELGIKLDLLEVQNKLKIHFSDLFGFEFVTNDYPNFKSDNFSLELN